MPWSNKELRITYETFRDKTLPGSEEKWKLKISGYKNEKVAAEMLASMYDASLDQFRPHSWSLPDIWNNYSLSNNWNGHNNFSSVQSLEKYQNEEYIKQFEKSYDRLLSRVSRLYNARMREVSMESDQLQSAVPGVVTDNGKGMMEVVITSMNKSPQPKNAKDAEMEVSKQPEKTGQSIFQIRKNFNETAFFFPDLKTDETGNIEFAFIIPEALTRWKIQSLAITEEAALGYSTKEIITQKQLMVQPNAPRFLREGDRMALSTKIVNLTDKELSGTVQLELFNAITMQPVDGWFQNVTANQHFTAEAGKSVVADFSIQIPYQFNSAVVYRFVAKGGSISDGEEASLPVLTNSMLVTESLPLPMRGNAAKNFRFEKLVQSAASETLQNHALTLEFSSNPVWYAIQALPYLAEIKYECSEQVFNRYYANALATKIANSSPRLRAIFEKWKSLPTSAEGSKVPSENKASSLASNLEKNPELKSVLLQETPWVLEAKSEAAQKKNITLLFDMVKMSSELQSSLERLKQFQSPNGGFVWFKGGPDDRFITQYILTGIGHLKKLDALPASTITKLNDITKSAMPYLDKLLKEDYDNLLKYKTDMKKIISVIFRCNTSTCVATLMNMVSRANPLQQLIITVNNHNNSGFSKISICRE